MRASSPVIHLLSPDGRAIFPSIDLSTDAGEKQDLAAQFPERVSSMRVALAEWRKENAVQYNAPNPGCDEAMFKALYRDVDPCRFDPLAADAAEWAQLQEWRKGMNAALRMSPAH